MNDPSRRSNPEVERLAHAAVEDPAMLELFLQALVEAPPGVREAIARDIEQALPAITRSVAGRATTDGDGGAMRLVLDVLERRIGDPEARWLMLKALGGDP